MIDLAEVLRGVPESGTSREQIQYIHLDRIDSDPNNFYQLTGIEELAANIELFGLQQPIRVRVHPEDADRFMIVSGHRRCAALRKLVEDGRVDMAEAACILEQDVGSPALQELRLIYANSDTRKLTPHEIDRQAERVEALLYQLKEEGMEFPGRMRDHVAEACKVSKSKLSRLKVIRDRLDPIWKPAYEAGDLAESVAYALAQMPDVHQRQLFRNREARGLSAGSLTEHVVQTMADRLTRIDKLGCSKGGGGCINAENMREKALIAQVWEHVNCTKCCRECYSLGTCKSACPCLSDEVQHLKDEAREKKAQLAAEKETKDRPDIEAIQRLWYRFSEARIRANMDVEDVFKAIGRYYGSGVVQEAYQLEAGEGKISTATYLPYGTVCRLDDAQMFVRAADALGCSLDWLLCRTDDPQGAAQVKPEPIPAQNRLAWHTPDQLPEDGQTIIVVEDCGFVSDEKYKNGRMTGSVSSWDEVAFWTEMPKESTKETQPTGQLMLCGWMPGGTNPAEPCDVVAVFNMGEGLESKQIVQWTGSGFAFKNGARIDMEPARWMALPPDDQKWE